MPIKLKKKKYKCRKCRKNSTYERKTSICKECESENDAKNKNKVIIINIDDKKIKKKKKNRITKMDRQFMKEFAQLTKEYNIARLLKKV